MGEMTYLESFRFIDTYAEAVLKLQEASHAIQRNGADLKEWEAKGKLVKDKIQKETAELTTQQAEKRRKGIIAIDALLEKEAKVKEQIEPTLSEARETREALDRVAKELEQALEDKASLIESAIKESNGIMKDAKDRSRMLESEMEEKHLKSQKRLVEVEAKIKQLKQEGIDSL